MSVVILTLQEYYVQAQLCPSEESTENYHLSFQFPLDK